MSDNEFTYEGESLHGRCSHCNRDVDNYDPFHRVTSILRGGKGVECAVRGDIEPSATAPLWSPDE